jgi:pimeloyl-ACP methyl ester carboxylesterase
VDDKPRNAAFLHAEARFFSSYSLEPRSRAIRLQKPAILVRAVEVGTGEPALFLHGFSLCAAHWVPLFARLSSLRRMAIDMPGHGASDGVDYRDVNLRSWYVEMLTSVLDELGVESAHMVGHSQGAMFAMWLARDAPHRVRSLVTIGTPAVALG